MTTLRHFLRGRSLASALVVLPLVLGTSWDLVAPPEVVGQEPTGRQVVMFGVIATPDGTTMDPKITPAIAARLRKILPNHSFHLIKVKSARVSAGQSVVLPLGGGFVSSARLVTPLDPNGKVQLRFDLSLDGFSQFQSIVTTPADQFNFFDKMMPDDSHLLIGIGAR